MEKLATKAIERATDRILTEFQRDYITEYVYTDNVKMYERTYDFIRAWDWTPIKKEINKVSTMMWYNAGKMDFNLDKFQHGSKYSTPESVIASLMEILDKKGRSSSLWLSNGVNRKEAYFQKFIEDFFKGGRLERILSEELEKVGFSKL